MTKLMNKSCTNKNITLGIIDLEKILFCLFQKGQNRPIEKMKESKLTTGYVKESCEWCGAVFVTRLFFFQRCDVWSFATASNFIIGVREMPNRINLYVNIIYNKFILINVIIFYIIYFFIIILIKINK